MRRSLCFYSYLLRAVLAIGWLSVLFCSANSFAADSYSVEFQRNTPIQKQIQELELDADASTVTVSETVPPVYHFQIVGKIRNRHQSLLIKYEAVELADNEDNAEWIPFTYEFESSKETALAKVLEVSPLGVPARETILVQAKKDSISLKKSPHTFSVGLGLSTIRYTEGVVSLSELGLTAKLGYTYSFPFGVDIGGNVFGTVLPFGSSPDPSIQARFFGANGRVGYRLIDDDSWKLSMNLGFYYTTMFVSQNAFGVQGLMGPQVFPVVTKRLGKQNSLSAYFKLSTVSDGGFGLDLSNRELAGGLTFTHIFKNQTYGYTLSVDASNLNFTVDSIPVQSTSLSLGLGWTW